MKAKGGKWKQDLALINAGLCSIAAKDLDALADDPDVDYITPDREVRGSLDYAVPTVGADIASSYGWDGTGIGVAIIDSGIDSTNSPDIQGRLVYSESFLSGDTDPRDYNGHGVHVAGTVAGNGKASSGKLAGVAPNARLINLRVLDQNGVGTDSAVILAIQKASALARNAPGLLTKSDPPSPHARG